MLERIITWSLPIMVGAFGSPVVAVGVLVVNGHLQHGRRLSEPSVEIGRERTARSLRPVTREVVGRSVEFGAEAAGIA